MTLTPRLNRTGCDHVEKELVHAAVLAEFGVKRSGEDMALADEGGGAVPAGERFDAGTEAAEARCANVDRFKWAARQGGFLGTNGGVVLAAVGVALYGGVEYAKAALGRVGDLAGEQDAAGAGAEDGLGVHESVEDVVEAGTLEVLEKGGGFAAGDDQGIEFGEVFGLANETGDGAELGQALGVDVKSALKSEDTDDGGRFGHDASSIARRARSGVRAGAGSVRPLEKLAIRVEKGKCKRGPVACVERRQPASDADRWLSMATKKAASKWTVAKAGGRAPAKKSAAAKSTGKGVARKRPAKAAHEGNYTDPALREHIKQEVLAGDKGGKPGQWSARKAQMVAHEYVAQGGGYKHPPDEAQEHLKQWGDEHWHTADGKPAIRDDGKGGVETHRYLPDDAWKELSSEEKKTTDTAKVRGSRKGQQFVPNTEKAKQARQHATEHATEVAGKSNTK